MDTKFEGGPTQHVAEIGLNSRVRRLSRLSVSRLDKLCAGFGSIRTEADPSWTDVTDVGPMSTKFGKRSTRCGPMRPNVGGLRPNVEPS